MLLPDHCNRRVLQYQSGHRCLPVTQAISVSDTTVQLAAPVQKNVRRFDRKLSAKIRL
ncbi:hypothetical protein CSKR_202072 [Clonorchis sinensis]|uniref:Uncharacterized protein n=1 Tax=Clonorchis sinensis TaxID=79923 RepID=A0A8T1LV66_CLOSI|nr:hypothetical protein CSKR_202072 [Clonorchis sinensis]